MNKTFGERIRQFHEWQQRPHEVAPMTDETHRCTTCGQEFQGNYCPRCGQSASIGRYSFKKALLLFLDVWGLGNRGMFRTLRDLLFRPGYMIRDYLSGMQMAYFPPFKLFFLLTALSMVVESGFNIKGENYFQTSRETLKESMNENFSIAHDSGLSAEERRSNEKAQRAGLMVMEYLQRFPNLVSLGILVLISGFLYIFFRKSPNIPDLRYSELLVALVYSSNMLSIFQILTEFFGFGSTVQLVAQVLPIIPLKQMSGFSWLRTICYVLLVMLMMVAILMVCSTVYVVKLFMFEQQ